MNYNKYGNNSNHGKEVFRLDVEKVFRLYSSGDFDEFIKKAEEFSRKSKGVSSNQIRQFYDEIANLYENLNVDSENQIKKGLAFLKLKLAYSKGRKTITEAFYNNLKNLVDFVLNENGDINLLKGRFIILKEFMEAFVAYYKIYGGNN